MRVMGLNFYTLMKTRKKNKNFKHPPVTIDSSNLKKRVIIHTHVQKSKATIRFCFMAEKLKLAWMKMNSHSSLLQYSAKSCLTRSLHLICFVMPSY